MNLFKRLARWKKQRFLRHRRIPEKLWKRVEQDALLHYQLDKHELLCLRELASLFVQKKAIIGAHDLQLDDYQKAVIAATASVLILNLDFDYYDDWLEVIIYEGAFIVHRQVQDDAGVIHEQNVVLDGEAWGQGPVILAWDDAKPGKHPHEQGKGSNVIIHEFAHKLDMLNGAANGMPPLHSNMSNRKWTKVLTDVYQDLEKQLKHHHKTHIDPYAAESPAEFFAVISEMFFEWPARLHHYYPELYHQLKLFYRQDTLKRQVARTYPEL